MKKILIRVITYNQEDVIGRTLDSILSQKDWGLYRIVVSDDCSKDHTWEILKEYKTLYPEIMDIHRNEYNLGIYNNIECSHSFLPIDYDLFGDLAGDDAYCEGYFEAIQKYIEENNIDTENAIGIFSDWKTIDLEGNEKIFKQDVVLSNNSLFSLKARGLISSRSLLVSKAVLDSFEPFLHGRGLNLTESHYDVQPILKMKESYYLPLVASIYYTGCGISTSIGYPNSAYNTSENIEKWNYAIERYIKNDEDLWYAKYQIMKSEYYMQPTWGKLFKMYDYYRKGQLKDFREPFYVTLRSLLHNIKYKLTLRKFDSK